MADCDSILIAGLSAKNMTYTPNFLRRSEKEMSPAKWNFGQRLLRCKSDGLQYNPRRVGGGIGKIRLVL
jgi:hypothetical protein